MEHPEHTGDPVAMYAAMRLIRTYEEHIAAQSSKGPFPLTCPSVGQEASAVGAVMALLPEDLILTNHRSAAHLLARGADPGRLLAEVMGRTDGYCQGKSGSLHISAKELGVVLTSTIVGGELSLATGVALSQRMLKRPGIVACFFGDGAAAEGIFHESLNLASVWNLPILYICENNQWQAYVHRQETMRGDHIAPRAAGYGIDSRTVDGNDPQAVHAAVREARATILRTQRPYLLETWTYRLKGHLEPDDSSYVAAEERAHWQALDPLPRLAQQLRDSSRLSEAELAAMAAQASARIEAALAFAERSPYPDLSQLLSDVYA